MVKNRSSPFPFKFREENASSIQAINYVNLKQRLKSINIHLRQEEISWQEKLELQSQEFRCIIQFNL